MDNDLSCFKGGKNHVNDENTLICDPESHSPVPEACAVSNDACLGR
jgi:hypothetical protein